MKKVSIIILFIILYNSFAFTNENNCVSFEKYSTEYFKCKAEIIKQKTISAGKNIVEETKEYQKKEWSEGKEQIEDTKKQIKKTKEKVLEK